MVSYFHNTDSPRKDRETMTSTTAHAELAAIETQLSRYVSIPVAKLRAGMVGPKGEISNIREVYVGGERRIAWDTPFGMTGVTVNGYVDVRRDCVIHKVDIREKPEYDMGCYTGNYHVTAECTGCDWRSDTTFSGFMANQWAAEHERNS